MTHPAAGPVPADPSPPILADIVRMPVAWERNPEER